LPPGERTMTRNSSSISQIREGKVFIPTSIPPKAQIIVDTEPVLPGSREGVIGGIPGGDKDGVPGGILNGILNEVPRILPVVRPPEVKHEPPKSPATTAAPPRITSVRMASPVHRVDPVYPALAKQARVSGVVELLGVLGTDGRIHELQVLRGHPLLVKAAMDAVRQWVYEPTLLNGVAVEVSAPITVNFILN
jgi:protein TonB